MSEYVYIVVYEHKHGSDHVATRTELGAYKVATKWAHDSAVERFEGEDMAALDEVGTRLNANPNSLEVQIEYIAKFEAIEQNSFCQERFEVLERELID